MTETPKLDLLGYTRSELAALLEELGEKPYRAEQVLKWLHHRFVSSFDEMTDISKALRAYFTEFAEIHEPEVLHEKHSNDGTHKWVLKARSGSAIEMVFIPEDGRGTLCVSSQVGCALDCSFLTRSGSSSMSLRELRAACALAAVIPAEYTNPGAV